MTMKNVAPSSTDYLGHAEDRPAVPHSQTASKTIIQSADDVDSMFTHAPVSLWEEDFSEVKRSFDQLRRNGIEDLGMYLKKHPDQVLVLARMVRVVRVNKETLALYEAASPAEFREGLSRIFNKDSFEVFKKELIAFWKGRTSFTSEAVNLALSGVSMNILIHAHIPPVYEQTWDKVYIAITDITAIKDSTQNIAASEQKYRSVFDTTQTAIVLVDLTSGIIIEANKCAKKILGASNGELSGLHIADLVNSGEQKLVRSYLSYQEEQPSLSGQVFHISSKDGSKTSVMVNANKIELNDAKILVLSFAPINSAAHMRPKRYHLNATLSKKLSQRECEILRQICNGNTSKVIAQHLYISEKTVRTHRARIMQKLDIHCVVDLVKFAMSNGHTQFH